MERSQAACSSSPCCSASVAFCGKRRVALTSGVRRDRGESCPGLELLARRQGATRLLAAEYGVRQFLDIGAELPAADNTHEVAQRIAPESRIVYADYDPAVLRHAEELLTSTPEGKTGFIQADLRDTGTILAEAASTLGFSLHAPSDIRAEEVAEMARRYNATAAAPITPRSREQVARFFDGLDMIGPGLVNLAQWPGWDDADSGLAGYVGIGRKPV